MIKLGHGAMLEHGTIYLKIRETVNGNIPPAMLYWRDCANRKYSKVYTQLESDSPYSANYKVLYVTTNLRVLVENNRIDDLEYQCEPTEYHENVSQLSSYAIAVYHMNLYATVYSVLLKRVPVIVTIVRINLVMSLLLLNHLGVISKI